MMQGTTNIKLKKIR